jgi:hypothetical protein
MHDFDDDNDGRFPDGSPVAVRYPRSKQEEQADRGTWPWLPGSIVEQCGPDEWYVCIEAASWPSCATAAHRTARPTVNLYYPAASGDGSEIRPRTTPSATRRGAGR